MTVVSAGSFFGRTTAVVRGLTVTPDLKKALAKSFGKTSAVSTSTPKPK
jgi:hypothetical protein